MEGWITLVVGQGAVVSCMGAGMQVGIVAVVAVVEVEVEEVSLMRRIGNVGCRWVWGSLDGQSWCFQRMQSF